MLFRSQRRLVERFRSAKNTRKKQCTQIYVQIFHPPTVFTAQQQRRTHPPVYSTIFAIKLQNFSLTDKNINATKNIHHINKCFNYKSICFLQIFTIMIWIIDNSGGWLKSSLTAAVRLKLKKPARIDNAYQKLTLPEKPPVHTNRKTIGFVANRDWRRAIVLSGQWD